MQDVLLSFVSVTISLAILFFLYFLYKFIVLYNKFMVWLNVDHSSSLMSADDREEYKKRLYREQLLLFKIKFSRHLKKEFEGKIVLPHVPDITSKDNIEIIVFTEINVKTNNPELICFLRLILTKLKLKVRIKGANCNCSYVFNQKEMDTFSDELLDSMLMIYFGEICSTLPSKNNVYIV